MYCRKCGTITEENAAFCAECGAPIIQPGEENAAVAKVNVAGVNNIPKPINYQGNYATPSVPVQQNTNAAPYTPVQQNTNAAPYAPVQQNVNATQPTPKKKKNVALIVILIVVSVLLVLAIGAVAVLGFFGKLIFGDLFMGKEKHYVQEATTVNYDLFKEFEDSIIEYEESYVQQEVVTEVATQLVRDEYGNYVPVTEIVTEIVTERVAEESKGLNSVDYAEIADYYNKAVANTYGIDGNQTMVLSKAITGDGAMGAILQVIQPVISNTLSDNCKPVYEVPGSDEGLLMASDITDAYARSKNGKTEIYIELRGQNDGAYADKNLSGPVSRGIGTLGNFDNVMAELGMTMESGRDTVSVTYSNAYIMCEIDEETGKIINGEWAYTADIHIGDAKVSSPIGMHLMDFSTAIDYKARFD